MPRRIWKSIRFVACFSNAISRNSFLYERHVHHMLIPWNVPSIYTSSHSQTNLPSFGHWYVVCLSLAVYSFHHVGTVVLLIGASLVGSSGVPNWGGGASDCKTAPTGIFALCPTTLAPKPLPWGAPQFIGLGFLSFISIVLTEMFGSPFLKNISIIVGLAVGCIVSGAAGYIDGSSITTAPSITFLW